MKKIDLERKLRALGWRYDHDGGSHEIWAFGKHKMSIPRHREVKEQLARSIVRKAANLSRSH